MSRAHVMQNTVVFSFFSCLLIAPGLAGGGEAPEVEWTQPLAQSVTEGQGSPLVQTSDGGYIVAGYTLMKTDARGKVVWETPFEHQIYPSAAVQQTADGGYIVGGTYYGPCNGSDSMSTSQDAALIKVDAGGAIVWQKAFGNGGEDAGFAVEACTDGGYVVAGFISGSEGVSLLLVKTDGDGNQLWQRTYPGGGYAAAYSIDETQDGGFIVAGERGGSSEGAYLLRVDANGNRLWDRRVAREAHVNLDLPSAARETPDGGYLLVGSAFLRSAETGCSGGIEGYLKKTDADGNVLWTRSFQGHGMSRLFSVSLTADGGAIATGWTQVPPAGEVDVYIVKVGQDGEVVWEKPIEAPSYDVGICVVQTSDGGYAACARSGNAASLIKLAPDRRYPGPVLRRGDVGGEGLIDLSDGIFTINYLFGGGPEPSCLDSSDTDDDGVISITDGIGVLRFLFMEGQAPSTPGPYLCGPDPTPDGLSCDSPGACAQ